jgi:hypothetical protein
VEAVRKRRWWPLVRSTITDRLVPAAPARRWCTMDGAAPAVTPASSTTPGRPSNSRPMRRARTHRTHGEVIGVRAARDHAVLRPLPARPYVVAARHLRHVGKDCVVAFDANLYSVPARRVRPGQLVEIRATAATIALHATVPDADGNTPLATHARAVGRGARIVDPTHWDGLPDGHTRAVTTGEGPPASRSRPAPRPGSSAGPLQALLSGAAAAQVTVDRGPLSVYDQIAGTGPFIPASRTDLKDTSS